ncbi:MAG: 2-hydroxychromene-2-carboxylate isomerase [Notoacmeibacter sp.]|nr:2-hydroxychromene-2-carboxylate isomerase [Notoacmeibacter sp.]
MARQIDYFFTCVSPFSYFGHRALHDVARKHGAHINYRPVRLGDVFASSGAVPLAQRTPARQRYRLIELQRIAGMRGLPINLKPAFFPADPSLADATVVALVLGGKDPFSYIESLYRVVWVDDCDVADEAVVASRLTACGFDASAVLAGARTTAVADAITRNSQDAVAAGAMGSPTYVLDGEPFWGQDRIGYLDHALTTGRPAFTA